ncbi:MAG: hydrogenase formation protein HypD [Pseudomonadota bacterium]|jgi:hydrogenase expression/formation protein HypD
MELETLFNDFRNVETIKALQSEILKLGTKRAEPLRVMEVCGGHTHTIMKYGINRLCENAIEFVHGPGCPVCIMPKERIDAALALARMPNTILCTLGDMIRVPGSNGSLAKARSEGADVRFLYSPMEILQIAKENPEKAVIYFAIGFETTTPMSVALLDRALGLDNFYLATNHVLVPPPMRAILDDTKHRVEAFLAPAHVSVITGYKIYEPIAKDYKTPIVVGGFEPADVMSALLSLLKQSDKGEAFVENEYSRSVTRDGNLKAQEMMDKYFCIEESFRWRGIGEIPYSSVGLKPEYAKYNAWLKFEEFIPKEKLEDNKACICGDVLKGAAKPTDCKVFGSICTPQNPLGSCMVSSEGACAAYFKYGNR